MDLECEVSKTLNTCILSSLRASAALSMNSVIGELYQL